MYVYILLCLCQSFFKKFKLIMWRTSTTLLSRAIGSHLRRSCCKYSSSSSAETNQVPQDAPLTKEELAEIIEQIPIEKRSLSRGLMINKFEKDFIIYPEYENGEEVAKFKTYLDTVNTDIGKALAQVEQPSGLMPEKVRQILIQQGIFAAPMPKEYGGSNFKQKDILQLAECMGSNDLSLFNSYNHVLAVTNLITQYGTNEQKERYLPGIACGKWRPSVCWQEDTTGHKPTAQVVSLRGHGQSLTATKVNVVDAVDANMFIVFAHRQIGEELVPSWYIIEMDSIKNDPISSIKVVEEVRTSGLQHCNFSTVIFDNVPVDDSLLIGQTEDSAVLLEELTFSGKTLYGAAVTGFLKKLIGELCTFANTEIKGNLRLSDSHPVKKAIHELGIITYVLESMTYYIGGLNDEGLFLMQDIENSIIQRFSNKALRQAISTITDVAGICSTDQELPYDKMIKDSIALMSLSDPDLHLVRRITLPTIEHFVNNYGGMKRFMRLSEFSKIFMGNDLNEYLHPNLVHFIAEHVHQSLHFAAIDFEYSVGRLNKVFDILVNDKGVYLGTDYVQLQNIATLMENNLAMIATLARASRSYSIGLRNSDFEIRWTEQFCTQAGKESRRIVREAIENGGKIFPETVKVLDSSMLEANGYCLESPLEKNW